MELKVWRIASAPASQSEDASPFVRFIAEIRSTSKLKMTVADSTTNEFTNAPCKLDLFPLRIQSVPRSASFAHSCFIRDSQPPPPQMKLPAGALASTSCEIMSTH